MQKLLVIAAASLVAMLLVAPLVRADGGVKDFAVGGFRGVDGINNVGFSAHSDPDGANPQGYLTQTIPEGKAAAQRRDHFTVTCLAVDGNHAALGLTPSDDPTLARFPNGRVLRVTDGGPGGTSDKYGYTNGTTDCQSELSNLAPNTLESGDILVNDEP
jgi:hypothetical protein